MTGRCKLFCAALLSLTFSGLLSGCSVFSGGEEEPSPTPVPTDTPQQVVL